MRLIKIPALLVEFKFDGQIERWKIKVKKCVNMPTETIHPRFSRRSDKEIRYLTVGRNVRPEKIEAYFRNYLRNKGLLERMVRMQLIT